jgi:hypothetical protein
MEDSDARNDLYTRVKAASCINFILEILYYGTYLILTRLTFRDLAVLFSQMVGFITVFCSSEALRC